MNLQSNFGYCIITKTLIIAQDKQTDGWMDEQYDYKIPPADLLS